MIGKLIKSPPFSGKPWICSFLSLLHFFSFSRIVVAVSCSMHLSFSHCLRKRPKVYPSFLVVVLRKCYSSLSLLLSFTVCCRRLHHASPIIVTTLSIHPSLSHQKDSLSLHLLPISTLSSQKSLALVLIRIFLFVIVFFACSSSSSLVS